ncbi:MAG: SbcC/MukB-like Walker B domain-containing protein, partial [Armatimonadota bacterium]
CIELQTSLQREPAVRDEEKDLARQAEVLRARISQSEASLAELAFSPQDHQEITKEYEDAAARLNAAAIDLERRKGEVAAASAVLEAVRGEEEKHRSRLAELKSKRSEHLHLRVLAEAFDRLRAELNDRIRPELESVASELLAVMTDGRYNVLRVNNDYKALIVDDGEEKPVISGGEDDIVNLALRLAISQMIADRAGQSFSLLILDEVFGSLDESRRDNVVALLQSLKNRFEQIILITHVESIHDAVDNCLWVEFDEKTKTSRLAERSADNLVPSLY